MIESPWMRLTPVRFASTTSEAPPRASRVAPTWARLPGGVVDGGEIILLAIKPSMWRPLFDSAPWLMTCCLLVVALTWLGRPIAGLSLTASAQVIVLVAFARIAMAVMRWVPTWYVLTNRRVIDIQGVRAPRVSSCPLIDVRNTYLHSSPAEKVTRLGTITFVTDHSSQEPRVWQSITKPDEVHAEVRRAIESAIDRHGLSG